MADCSTFSTVGAMRLLVVRSVVSAVARLLAADQVHHQPRLLRRDSDVSCFRFGLHVYPPPLRPAWPIFSVAAFTECPLNVRVGENSPSLCPTMFSVTYTGMNFFPLCTAIVWPTNSGRMVERRDQVRTTFFSFVAVQRRHLGFQVSVGERSLLYAERAHSLTSSCSSAFTIHLSVRLLLRVLKPRVGWPHGVTGCRPPRGFALAAAVRVIHRVHRDAAIVRHLAHPALASGLAERYVFVLDVAHLADGRHALHRHAADFARGQLQQRDAAFVRNQLRLRAGRARHLRALAGLQLDVVNHRAGRDVLQRQRIADQNVGRRART